MSRNIIVILRGVCPYEAAEITGVLLRCVVIKIEVTVNSPEPFEIIAAIV